VLQSDLAEFGGYAYLCKLGKKYLNALVCKFVVYFLQHSETFDVLHVFLPLTIAGLSMLKQVRFFGPPCTTNNNKIRYGSTVSETKRPLRKRGHNFVLPQCNSNLFKVSFFNRCLLRLV